jgi:hypothetical protein
MLPLPSPAAAAQPGAADAGPEPTGSTGAAGPGDIVPAPPSLARLHMTFGGSQCALLGSVGSLSQSSLGELSGHAFSASAAASSRFTGSDSGTLLTASGPFFGQAAGALASPLLALPPASPSDGWLSLPAGALEARRGAGSGAAAQLQALLQEAQADSLAAAAAYAAALEADAAAVHAADFAAAVANSMFAPHRPAAAAGIAPSASAPHALLQAYAGGAGGCWGAPAPLAVAADGPLLPQSAWDAAAAALAPLPALDGLCPTLSLTLW